MPKGGTVVFPAAMFAFTGSKKASVLHHDTCPKISPEIPGSPFTHFIAASFGEAFVSLPSVSSSCNVSPLKPNQRPMEAPAGRFGTTGAMEAFLPASRISGWYMEISPVAGSKTAASANACCVPTAIEHGGINRNGVASPSADRALSGIVTKQFVAFGSSAMAVVALLAAEDAATDAEAVLVLFDRENEGVVVVF